jgi:hypothetical protein
MAHQRLDVEHLLPEGPAEEDDRDAAIQLAGLRQGEDLEQFVPTASVVGWRQVFAVILTV